jgi:hypothetical protein
MFRRQGHGRKMPQQQIWSKSATAAETMLSIVHHPLWKMMDNDASAAVTLFQIVAPCICWTGMLAALCLLPWHVVCVVHGQS